MTLHSGRDMPPQKLYETYKERQIIGDSNKAYKHMPDHTASWMQDDKAFDEWLFLSHISWMLYCRLFNPIKRKGLVSGYSAEDIIAMMKRVKMQSANGERNLQAGTKAGHDQLKAAYPDEVCQILEKSDCIVPDSSGSCGFIKNCSVFPVQRVSSTEDNV